MLLMSLRGIEDNITLKRYNVFSLLSLCLRGIEDNITLKHLFLKQYLLARLRGIEDNITLKPGYVILATLVLSKRYRR